MAAKRLLVDIHTHVYLPRYANVLRSRNVVPRIVERASAQGGTEERLVLFPDEPISGRPVGPQVRAFSLASNSDADNNALLVLGQG